MASPRNRRERRAAGARSRPPASFVQRGEPHPEAHVSRSRAIRSKIAANSWRGTATSYEVLPLYDGAALVGHRLLKADGTMYDVRTAGPHGWTCDCPDANYHPERPGGCKHAQALRAALAALAW